MRFSRPAAPVPEAGKFALTAFLNDLIGNLAVMFNRGISFDSNIDVVSVSFSSNVLPDTEDAVTHTLGRVPTGFIVKSLDKAATVYQSGTAFTSTQIFVKTNVASAAVQLILL